MRNSDDLVFVENSSLFGTKPQLFKTLDKFTDATDLELPQHEDITHFS